MAKDGDTGRLLWQAANRWQAAQRATLRPFGLTHVQYLLLASLVELGRAVSQRELAEEASTDPMMTSQVVRTLEAKGLLTRQVHPTDGRAWSVRATRSGIALSRRAGGAVARCDADFFSSLGRNAATLRTALKALAEPQA
jgi:DNA-binding MarR family transcriptional regulator